MFRLKSNTVALLVSAMCLAGVGCAKNEQFRDDAFYSTRYPYRVEYAGKIGQFISSKWRLDNYQVNKKGEFEGAKQGSRYRTRLKLDVDDDGKYGESGERSELVDPVLLLLHRKHDARIRLTMMPMSREYAERELRVLARNYVDARSGGVSASVRVSGGVVTAERRLATRVLESKPIKMYGRDAYMVTYEIADMDQVTITPEARWERARVVLLRPGYVWHHKKHLRSTFTTSKVPNWPVLMVLSYSNLPEDFVAGLDDFARFSEAVDLLDDGSTAALYVPPSTKCDDRAEATVTVEILPDGRAHALSLSGLDPGQSQKLAGKRWLDCLEEVPFQSTGEVRTVRFSYAGATPRVPRRHDVLRVPVEVTSSSAVPVMPPSISAGLQVPDEVPPPVKPVVEESR